MNRIIIDPVEARAKFMYDPATGIIYHRERTNNKVRDDLVAGCKSKYAQGVALRISWKGRAVPAARMAWVLHNGEMPPLGFRVGLRDGDQFNLSSGNLVLLRDDECGMVKRSKRGSVASLKGVSWHKRDNVWQANIKVGPRKVYLGSFKTADAAHAAYLNAAKNSFGQFARDGEWHTDYAT